MQIVKINCFEMIVHITLTSMSGGMTESSVRVMIWKLYWSSLRNRLEPMKVNTGIMLCSTRDWEGCVCEGEVCEGEVCVRGRCGRGKCVREVCEGSVGGGGVGVWEGEVCGRGRCGRERCGGV